MKTHKWSEVRRSVMSPERVRANDELIAREVAEMDLRELRESLGLTQEQAARAAEMTQSELSRAERREDHKLSTLERIVHALGGEIEVSAVFGSKRVVLRRT